MPLHIDGASGAFVAPFLHPDLVWDFRLPLVKSINASGHKYGLVYPGVGWVMWRSHEELPEELVFHVNYLGGDMPTFTLNFSRAGNQVVGQYYNFLRLGRACYTMPEGAEDVAVMRVVVREGFSRDLADSLLKAIRDAVAFFEENPPAESRAQTPAFAH